MKKKTTKLLALLLICAMIMSIAPMAVLAEGEPAAAEPQSSATPWDGTSTKQPSGTGEENDPYLIGSADELAWVAQEVNGSRQANRYYKLTADINLNNELWTPIGSSNDPFSGTFYGDQHHTIKGLYINSSTSQDASALFGVMESGTLKNFSVEGIVTGGIRGSAAGVLAYANFKNQGTVNIENVSSSVAVSSAGHAGGIVGDAEGGVGSLNIKVSYNSGKVSSSGNSGNVGGIVGYSAKNVDLSIDISYNMGTVSYTGTPRSGNSYPRYVPGGIVGRAMGKATIKDGFNAGEIESSSSNGSGAIVGYANANVSVENCSYLKDCYYKTDGTAITPGVVANRESSQATPFTDKLSAPSGTEKIFTKTKDISVRVDGNNKTVTIPAFDWESVVSNVNVTFEPATGGTYTVDGTKIAEAKTETAKSPAYFELEAAAADGYKFVRWVDGEGKEISTDAEYRLTAESDMTVRPVFSLAEAAWGVGTARYDSLDEAAAAALASKDKTIILLNDQTLAGRDAEYVIPEGVTLLIPYSDANIDQAKLPVAEGSDNLTPDPNFTSYQSKGKIYAYRTLTMDSGARLTVNGALCVGGYYYSPASGKTASMSGGYGCIQMNEGSSITVNGGASLYVWGFISGKGTIDVKNGAKVYEWFQITDFRGGSGMLAMMSSSVFMFSQYYVQNVEVAMTLEKGADERVFAALTQGGTGVMGMPINFIGQNGMFKVLSGSFTKDYDEKTDKMVFTVRGEAELNSLQLSVTLFGARPMEIDSGTFVLPITNNITLNIKSGSTVTVNQDVALLPGSEVDIENGAKLVANSSCMYVYDLDEWQGKKYVFSDSDHIPAVYQPGREAGVVQKLADAKILVNGTLQSITTTDSSRNVKGGIYTTESGANICSTGAGLFIQTGSVGTAEYTYQRVNNDGTAPFDPISISPAFLKNEDENYYEDLIDASSSGAQIRYTNGEWKPDSSITWRVNNDVTTVYVPYGQKPVYTGSIPSKPMTDSGDRSKAISYRFVGWKDRSGKLLTNDIPAATADAVYTAEFKPVRAYYNIALGVKLGDGADVIPLRTTTYYNANAARKLTTPAVYKTDTANYVFDHWEVTLGGEMDATYKTHQITIRPNQGGEYSAVAVYRLADTAAAESPEVHLTETYTEIVAANDDQQDRLLMKAKYKTCATMTFTVPEGYTINDVGFVVSIKDSNKDPVYQDGSSLSSLCGSWSGNSGLFSGAYTVHINMSNYQLTNTYIKAYLKVTDAQGIASTIYSAPVSCTFNALNGK